MQDNATQIGINHPSHSGNVRFATSIATASELKKLLKLLVSSFVVNQIFERFAH